MKKIVIFGNSGSGKSTFAKHLSKTENLAHLDLDTIAWLSGTPPERRSIDDSKIEIDRFLQKNQAWVVEGCYSDLLELVIAESNEMIFLNLPVADCIANAKNRPWEPHKYESKQAQDENLEMLLNWISDYTSRSDTFSLSAHEALYSAYEGKKTLYCNNDREKNA